MRYKNTKLLIATFVLLMAGVLTADGGIVRQRLTPKDINARAVIGNATGTSGVAGIQTRLLAGNPNVTGIYTIQISVPANTRIQAHLHPDDRVATVISGTWFYGFGSQFDESKMVAMTAGSFYTEPANDAHFAMTAKTPVVLHVTGFGPSGTRFTNPAKNPKKSKE